MHTGDDNDLSIADAYQHFFDIEKNYYSWLCDRPLKPLRYGDYESNVGIFCPLIIWRNVVITRSLKQC
ncbi:hypothetical protein BSU04_27320 [Caballeronia sordidicola]|uniref:Uncharacterized protein n=1 Tax=Caballeronia sordidicola TaxID=196367 RepID=A0A226WVZ0_CABSO|nr:hypothetical protein BSU04_27320 [Caballeronia sordidicola]